MTSGVLYVHSCPPALCPHVEWAVTAELGARARMEWSEQPSAPGQLRAEINWRGRPGTAGRLAAALKGWSVLRYEVTEDASPGVDGERYAVTPTLGVFRASMSANGIPSTSWHISTTPCVSVSSAKPRRTRRARSLKS